jgi:hypothetical protein
MSWKPAKDHPWRQAADVWFAKAHKEKEKRRKLWREYYHKNKAKENARSKKYYHEVRKKDKSTRKETTCQK